MKDNRNWNFSVTENSQRAIPEYATTQNTLGIQSNTSSDGNNIELFPGTGVYINRYQLNKIFSTSKLECSKLTRCLLEYYFDDQYLAGHCAKGKTPFGSNDPRDSRPAIDATILGAIKEQQETHLPVLDGNTSYNTNNKNEIECSHCTKTFKSRHKYIKHLSLYHPFGFTGTLKCQYCRFKCDEQDDLDDHVEDEHKFVCKNCNKTFISLPAYQNHNVQFHGDPGRKYPCEICGKIYPSVSRLKIHSTSHSNERLHQCTECDRSYKYKHGLRDHIKLHHPDLIGQINTIMD